MLGVRLSRYKFVSKMFSGFPLVLEVGCGDGRLSRIVSQTVGTVILTDAEPQCEAVVWNPLKEDWRGSVDGVYALDVLEHVSPEDTGLFLERLSKATRGAAIIGMPSLEAWEYGSRKSKESHVNCMTESQLKACMKEYFSQVFMFGMNDEVVHTGFGPMCHYRLALGVK